VVSEVLLSQLIPRARGLAASMAAMDPLMLSDTRTAITLMLEGMAALRRAAQQRARAAPQVTIIR
jgi:hypothetical protein